MYTACLGKKPKKKIFFATPCLILALYGHRPSYFRPSVPLEHVDRHVEIKNRI